ncbi:MAG: hypothetical protein HYU67_06605 [Flavobacteriia bacterium]|nr:hypothetical protein [Flavobacteriia bacterium]
MIHRGEVIEQAVRNSGMSITKIAQKIGKSRRWMYHIETMFKIGKIINYNFSSDINISNLSIEKSSYTMQVEENKNENYWQEKYLALLEEHAELLRKLNK